MTDLAIRPSMSPAPAPGTRPAPVLPLSRSPALLLPLAAFLPRSRANGPGLRSVLWVQGCPLRCAGCFNPQFQPFSGGRPTPVQAVVDRILACEDTEGVTFSGGEPLAHAPVLAVVAERVRSAGKSVMVFTGYEAGMVLRSDRPDWRRLLAATDLLIAGPYRQDRPSRHPWLGSSNQEVVFLTDRYGPEDVAAARRRAEFRIDRTGRLTVTGFPPPERQGGTTGEGESGRMGQGENGRTRRASDAMPVAGRFNARSRSES